MPTIINPLPYVFVNGTTIDATQMDADLGQIVSNVNVLGTTAGAALVGATATTNNLGATVQAQLNNVGGVTGATNVGYTPPGTGAVTTTVGAWLTGAHLDVVNGFGADPTGVADSATAFNNCMTECAVLGCQMWVPVGTYTLGSTFTLLGGVDVIGAGARFTILQGKAGTTMDVVQTTGFAGLTGTGALTGPYKWSLQNLTIDGNKAARAAGRCLSIFGYDFRLKGLVCKNSPVTNIWSEWGLGATVPVVAGGDSMESHWTDVKSFGSAADGIDFNGPHDSVFTDVFTFINAGIGFFANQTANYSGACVINNLHSYGNQLGMKVGPTTVLCSNLQVESNSAAGALGGLLVVAGATFTCAVVSAYSNTGYGICNSGATDFHIASMRSVGNSGDGFLHSGGAGITVGVALLYGNGGFGLNGVLSNDNYGCVFSQTNTGGGIQVTNAAAGFFLAGQASSNTGTQLVLNTPGAGYVIQMVSFTAAGQTGYSGTPNASAFMDYVSIGNSNQAVHQRYATANGVPAITLNTTRTSGGSTPIMGTNKPGASTGVGPSNWIPVQMDGVTYYVPAWSA